jgi:hypothetical protein
MPAWRLIRSAVRPIRRLAPTVASILRSGLKKSLFHRATLSVNQAPINYAKRNHLMSLLETVEFPRLQADSGFVMPAQAGIQVRFQFQYKRLDSGLRRNDGRRVDFQSPN